MKSDDWNQLDIIDWYQIAMSSNFLLIATFVYIISSCVYQGILGSSPALGGKL